MIQLQDASTHDTPLAIIRDSGHATSFMEIPREHVRRRILEKVETMLAIDHAIASGTTRSAAVVRVVRLHRGRSGFSRGTLNRDYDLWRRGGQRPGADGVAAGPLYEPRDWRIFLPRWNNGSPKAAITNPAFVRHILALHADTTRPDAMGNALHDRLLDQWYAGEDIPGYGNIREWCARNGRPVPDGRVRRPADIPPGWSPDNLRRMIPRSQAYRHYVQRGEHAAHSHWGEQLLRDRSKLMPLQLITFDDVRFDIRVIMDIPGRKAQIVHPHAIFALDVATGLILAKGVLGSYTREQDEDGGKAATRRGLQQADTRHLLHSVLETFGLPESWKVNILLENASASLSAEDQAAFTRLTGISFENTGLIRSQLTKSGFVEQGGMPWQKGWVEAFFRAMHCRINHLPGTTGRRYDLTAGRRDAEDRYAIRMITDAIDAGRDPRELDLPILYLDQFHQLLDEYVLRLNWRTRHNLQGFRAIYETEVEPGLYITHDHPEASRLITPGTTLEKRMEAPAERAERLMSGHKLTPLHPRQLMPLALDKRPVTIRSDRATITLGGVTRRYHDAESAEALSKYNGREKALLGFLSTDHARIHLFTNDENLTYIASPRAIDHIDITDQHAIEKRSGQVHRSRQSIRDQAAAILAPREQQLARMREHNDHIISNPTNHPGDIIARAETQATRRRSAPSATEILAARAADDDTEDPF